MYSRARVRVKVKSDEGAEEKITAKLWMRLCSKTEISLEDAYI